MPGTPRRNIAFNQQIQLNKCLTGIKGFDEITEGGLPKNRTTYSVEAPGLGKPFGD